MSDMVPWTIAKSEQLYGFPNWGAGYFRVNECSTDVPQLKVPPGAIGIEAGLSPLEVLATYLVERPGIGHGRIDPEIDRISQGDFHLIVLSQWSENSHTRDGAEFRSGDRQGVLRRELPGLVQGSQGLKLRFSTKECLECLFREVNMPVGHAEGDEGNPIPHDQFLGAGCGPGAEGEFYLIDNELDQVLVRGCHRRFRTGTRTGFARHGFGSILVCEGYLDAPLFNSFQLFGGSCIVGDYCRDLVNGGIAGQS